MGIFGSRKKTTVGTVVSRVIEDPKLPDSVRSGAMRSIIKGDGQLIENSLEELAGGLAVRIRRMYRYGKNQYVHGLPSGTTMTDLMGKATIDAAIEAEVGIGVEVDYYHYGPANLLHFGWLVLLQDHEYNSITNTMMVEGRTVYLTDMQPVISNASLDEMENGSLDVWGIAANAGVTPDRPLITSALTATKASPFVVDPAAVNDHVRVKYCWQEDEVVLVEGVSITRKKLMRAELALSLLGFDLEASYHQARYMKDGKAGYWIYQPGSGMNPDVEQIFETAPQPEGTFFPFAYFRYDKQNTALDTTSTEFKSTRKLLKTINMDFADVAEAINENPDITDVEQAMLMLAVPARSNEPIEQRYLFDFFENLHQESKTRGAASLSMDDWSIKNKLRIPTERTSIVIQDKKFKMALSWQAISRRRIAGSIGPKGTYAALTNIDTDTKKGVTLLGEEVLWSTNVPTHIYRRQVTENLFDEIQVTNLKMTYHIWGEFTTTGDENDDILMIPLDYAIISDYSLPERELLAARSMHFVFNSRTVTKLKWYQTGVFRALLVIVAIIITVLSYGATVESIYAAIAAGATTSAVIMMVVVPLLEYIFYSMLVRLFVKVVGTKVAFIVAIIAAAFGMYQAIDAGSLAGAPWAKELLSLSTNLSSAGNAALKNDMEDLLGMALALKEEMKTKTELLKKTQDLLNDSSMHLNPMIIFGESPDDFYQRTVHSGNIGVVGIEAVEYYVDTQLTLPKISETLGELV